MPPPADAPDPEAPPPRGSPGRGHPEDALHGEGPWPDPGLPSGDGNGPPRPRLPQLTLDDLEQDLEALEARRRRLGRQESAGDESRYILEALIRNRRNLIELIKAGRFI